MSEENKNIEEGMSDELSIVNGETSSVNGDSPQIELELSPNESDLATILAEGISFGIGRNMASFN